MARPKDSGKYKKEYDAMANVACVEGGFTLVSLAKLFGVNKSTISRWMNKNESFCGAVKRGRDEFNVSVAEDCLLKRIKGYQYTEITQERKVVKDPTKKEESVQMVTTKIVTKSVAPDPTSIIFFLKNRDPERWREKAEVTHYTSDLERLIKEIDGTTLGPPSQRGKHNKVVSDNLQRGTDRGENASA